MLMWLCVADETNEQVNTRQKKERKPVAVGKGVNVKRGKGQDVVRITLRTHETAVRGEKRQVTTRKTNKRGKQMQCS